MPAESFATLPAAASCILHFQFTDLLLADTVAATGMIIEEEMRKMPMVRVPQLRPAKECGAAALIMNVLADCRRSFPEGQIDLPNSR
jgi:hypothetical protein